MFNCSLDAKLRGCDLVRRRASDVSSGGMIHSRATIIQQKTGRPVPFELTDATRDAMRAWLTERGTRLDDWVFRSRSHAGAHRHAPIRPPAKGLGENGGARYAELRHS